MILLSEPYINVNGNEWKYIKDCLDTGWVSTVGSYVSQFEKKISQYVGCKFAVACMNGTSALHIALRLAGITPENEVIVPTLTFIAPINAVRYNGAIPVFMDVDDYYNIDTDKLIDFLKKETEYKNGYIYNKQTKRRIKAIIAVHLFGNAVWLDEILSICEKYNVILIEDACESLGTFYCDGRFKGRHTGTIGRAGCLSFNGNKIITSGGGGMLITDDEEIAQKATYLTTQAKDDPLFYLHDDIGYNYRMTNIQAALGVAQLERLPEFLEKKQLIHKWYKDALKDNDNILLADTPPYSQNNHWLNIVRFPALNDAISIEEMPSPMLSKIISQLSDCNIQTRPAWYPNHLQRPYRKYQAYYIENAIQLANTSLCLPSSVTLQREDVVYIIQSLNKILEDQSLA